MHTEIHTIWGEVNQLILSNNTITVTENVIVKCVLYKT